MCISESQGNAKVIKNKLQALQKVFNKTPNGYDDIKISKDALKKW